MKILIPCGDKLFESNSNPYVRVLMDGLEKFGHVVDHGVDKLWNSFKEYDLIYFQWPEALYNWELQEEGELYHLKKLLDEIRSSGVKIVITCHNLHPHNNDPIYARMYNLIYSKADAIHHLGSFSCNLFKEKYSKALNFIAPHPIFYDCRKMGLSKKEARQKFNLPLKGLIVLSFGQFRDDSERNLVYTIRKNFPEVTLYCPRFIKGRMHKKLIWESIPYLFKVKHARSQRIYASLYMIKDEDVASCFNAADIVFIQRNEILNSGNLPLGFSAGKIVIGPKRGNVETILKDTGNPVFIPGNEESLVNAVKQAIELYKDGNRQGDKNYQIAITQWKPDQVASIINENINKLAD